ncbi:BAG family molecular chaperone regulator 4-like protein [Tanacetum coccineum]
MASRLPTELLMKELPTLDGIEGEAKAQKRIKGFVDILDNLKSITSTNHFNNRISPTVSVTTKWETFDSGVGSPHAPSHTQTSTKITKNWEQFD